MTTELIDQETSPSRRPEGTMSLATTRQAQEVQAAMIVAKNYPRDETHAIHRILTSCKRRALAECAMYEYPRGGQKITGPSIRLAEAMAQGWGNIDYGIIELEQKPGESVAMAYAWDLETNTRRQMVFTVRHIRQTKQGQTLLTDPRDIYEMVANQGARRVRACILGVLPGDVQDLAVEECEKTLRSGNQKPLVDRVRDMVIAFADLGVTQQMIEARLGHPTSALSENQFAGLRKVYTSIRDGVGQREDFFDLNAGAKGEEAHQSSGQSRTERAAQKAKQSKSAEPEPTAEQPPEQERSQTESTPAAEQKAAGPVKQRSLGIGFAELEEQCYAVSTRAQLDAARVAVGNATNLNIDQRQNLRELLDQAEKQLQANGQL